MCLKAAQLMIIWVGFYKASRKETNRAFKTAPKAAKRGSPNAKRTRLQSRWQRREGKRARSEFKRSKHGLFLVFILVFPLFYPWFNPYLSSFQGLFHPYSGSHFDPCLMVIRAPVCAASEGDKSRKTTKNGSKQANRRKFFSEWQRSWICAVLLGFGPFYCLKRTLPAQTDHCACASAILLYFSSKIALSAVKNGFCSQNVLI